MVQIKVGQVAPDALLENLGGERFSLTDLWQKELLSVLQRLK